jgi:hypothetical protein
MGEGLLSYSGREKFRFTLNQHKIPWVVIFNGSDAGAKGTITILLNAWVLVFQPLPFNKKLEAHILVTFAFERTHVNRV